MFNWNQHSIKKHYALSLRTAVSLFPPWFHQHCSNTWTWLIQSLCWEISWSNICNIWVYFLGVVLGLARLYPVAITVQRRTIKDIILQNYHVPAGVSVQIVALSYFYSHKLKSAHEIFRCIQCCSWLTFNSPLRHWSRSVFTPWEEVQRCLRIHSALSLSGGSAAERKAKQQKDQASAPWRLGLGRDSVSGGGLLRTRCSSWSCMWVTAEMRRRREWGNRKKRMRMS